MRLSIRAMALAISLALLLPHHGFAVAREGGSCSKIGKITIVKSNKFKCVKKGKKSVWIRVVENKNDRTSTSSPAPSPNINTSPTEEIKFAPKISKSPEDLSVCRIPDQSNSRRVLEGPSIAYPIPTGAVNAQISTTGPIRAALIPIDFQDAPGRVSPESIYKDDLELIDNWMKWFSNGKSYYQWQAGKEWLRAPRPSYDYVALDTPSFERGNPLPGAKVGRSINSVQVAAEFYQLAAGKFDLENLDTVLFLYPENVIHIYDLIVRNGSYQGIGHPAKGPAFFESKVIDSRLLRTWIMATGALMYQNNYPLWSWILHEVLHNQGLQGHAPNQGSILGIMTNQWGASLVLNAWDTIILDWQRENEVYCVSKENLTEAKTVLLSPLEREEIGNKSIMIKLSKSQVLVIESRRYDKWSKGFFGYQGLPKDFGGVVVYKVDTTKTPLYGIVESDGNQWRDESEAFAYYIRNNNVNHGILQHKYGQLDLNFVMYKGESITSNGIKITLVESNAHDTITVQRID